jgi:O-antigen/teichoic acid export membrane protein
VVSVELGAVVEGIREVRNKINSYWAKYDGSVWLIGQALLRRAIASDFIRKVTATFATRIFLIGLSLLTSVIIARVLGPEGRGVYAVAKSIGAIGVQFCNLGVHTSNIYYVAKDRKLLPALVGNSLLISFCLGGFGAAIAGLIFYLQPNLAPLQGLILVLALMWIPVGLAYMLLQNLLLGIHEIRAYNSIEILSKTIAVLLLVIVIAIKAIKVEIIFGINLVFVIIGLLGVLRKLNVYLFEPIRPYLNLIKENIGYGFKAYLSCFFAFIVLKADLLVINYMLGEEKAGYYSVAANLADLIYMLPIVFSAILFPKLSSMSSNVDKWKLTKKAGSVMGLILLVISLGVMSISKPVIVLLFGEKFIPATSAFIYLMPGIFFLGMQNVVVQFLNSIGFPVIIVWIWLGVSIENVILNIYLVPIHGIVGASIASSICYLTIFLIVGVIIYGKLSKCEYKQFP